jgi:hypothetical protein
VAAGGLIGVINNENIRIMVSCQRLISTLAKAKTVRFLSFDGSTQCPGMLKSAVPHE